MLKKTHTLEDSSSWLLTSDTGDSGIFLESIFELVVEDFSVDKIKYFIGTSNIVLVFFKNHILFTCCGCDTIAYFISLPSQTYSLNFWIFHAILWLVKIIRTWNNIFVNSDIYNYDKLLPMKCKSKGWDSLKCSFWNTHTFNSRV